MEKARALVWASPKQLYCLGVEVHRDGQEIEPAANGAAGEDLVEKGAAVITLVLLRLSQYSASEVKQISPSSTPPEFSF